MSNNTKTSNKSLADVIESLDNTARIPALRKIVHSSMAKCIGSIRQHLREENSAYNREEPNLDQRNDHDENTRSAEQLANAMGFAYREPPLKQASLYHACYDYALSELLTLSNSKWDAPLSIEQMLEFMISKSRPLDTAMLQALAKAAKTSEDAIKRMHELESLREQEQLLEATPEIVATFNGFGENGYETVLEDLPPIDQHQLGVKVVEALHKSRDQVLTRVMRNRRIADLASVPILEDAATQVSAWVTHFEGRYSDEIREAIELGRNVQTLEDIAA